MMDVLFSVTGLALLALGGEWLVRVSLAIAKKMKLSVFLVSVVIIGFGTSMPELLVSVQAALQESPALALGNVIGSNICNTLLILGVSAMIATIPCKSTRVRRNIVMGIIASGFLGLLSLKGQIGRLEGTGMLLALAGYLVYSFHYEKKKKVQAKRTDQELLEHIEQEIKTEKMELGAAVFLFASSLVLLVAGAHLLVTGAVGLARHFGVAEEIIGLTLVALGTSLPELATAAVASWRGRSDIVIGNVLGSNLFNILGILGVASLIHPIDFSGRLAQQDVWILLATSALLAPVVLPGRTISRLEGAVLFVLYAGYISWLYGSA